MDRGALYAIVHEGAEVYTTEWQRMHTQICTHFFTSMERMPFPPPLRLLLVVECEGVWRTLVGLALRVPALCSNVSDERYSWGLDLGNAGIRLKPDPQPESSKSIPAEPPQPSDPRERNEYLLKHHPVCVLHHYPNHHHNNTMTITQWQQPLTHQNLEDNHISMPYTYSSSIIFYNNHTKEELFYKWGFLDFKITANGDGTY